MIELYATAHPRSGQTWLLRMLSYAMNATVDKVQYWGDGEPDGKYNLNKTHAREKFGPTVFIYRDPRDVVMSIWHYRTENQSIRQTIENLSQPTYNPNSDRYGKYLDFVRTWYKTGLAEVTVRYEDLHIDPLDNLQRVIYGLTRHKVSSEHINNAIFWNEFSAFKARNAPVMEHSMWIGKVGTWRDYFTSIEADLCQKYWGDLMLEQGYITGPEWVHEVRMK